VLFVGELRGSGDMGFRGQSLLPLIQNPNFLLYCLSNLFDEFSELFCWSFVRLHSLLHLVWKCSCSRNFIQGRPSLNFGQSWCLSQIGWKDSLLFSLYFCSTFSLLSSHFPNCLLSPPSHSSFPSAPPLTFAPPFCHFLS
jgi:hypothetical protein